MNRNWIFLGIYYVILLILPLGDLRLTLWTSLTVGFSILGIFLYRAIGDEILFYVYNFLALLGLVFSMGNYNPYSPITLGVAYALLSLLFIHMIYARFVPIFGIVRADTIVYTLLSIVIAYFSIYLFLIYPIGYGFWGVVMLIIIMIVLIYFLMRSSKSKDSSNSS